MRDSTTTVITGATDGLGKALATELAGQEGIRLILHGRCPERLALLREELASGPAEVLTVQADIAEMAQVHGLADQIAALTDRVSVLVNNAGVGAGEADGTSRQLTADGNELRFAVNHLAAFCLTQRLSSHMSGPRPPVLYYSICHG